MADDYLTQGIAALEAGDRREAHRLLLAATRATPNDARAWGWLYEVAESEEERMHCVSEVKRISPHDSQAHKKLDELAEQRFRQAARAAARSQETQTRQEPRRSGQPARWMVWGSLIGLVAIGTVIGALAAARSEDRAASTVRATAFPSLGVASSLPASAATSAALPALLPSATAIASSTPLSIFTSSPYGLNAGSSFVAQNKDGAKWEIKVVKAESAKTLTASFNTPMESSEGRFAILYMDVTNRSDSPQSFTAGDLLLIQDASGRTYEEIQSATFLMQLRDNINLCVDIIPNATKTCVGVYDISAQSDFYRFIPSRLADQNGPRVLLTIP